MILGQGVANCVTRFRVGGPGFPEFYLKKETLRRHWPVCLPAGRMDGNHRPGLTGTERLAHEIHAPGALDLTGELAVEPGGDAGEAAGEDFAGLGGEFREVFGLLVVHHIHLDVITAARHALVMLAEIDEARAAHR